MSFIKDHNRIVTVGTYVNNQNIALSKRKRSFYAANVESICQKVDEHISQGIKEKYS